MWHLCCVFNSLQLCPTLCNPMDRSLPGSCVHGILQAGILEWFAMPSSRGSSQPRDRIHISCIFTTSATCCCCCCCCCWVASVVSDSVRPHGLQPTRLLRPWDFPGKSTGLGCHCHLGSIQLAVNVGFLTKWLGPLSNMWKKKNNKVESVLYKRAGKTSNEANIEILKKKPT